MTEVLLHYAGTVLAPKPLRLIGELTVLVEPLRRHRHEALGHSHFRPVWFAARSVSRVLRRGELSSAVAGACSGVAVAEGFAFFG